MDKISQRQSYIQNRTLYFEKVLDLYVHGKTAREIARLVPISKSTIQRWVEEGLGKDNQELPEGVAIPRTPKAVAKMIKSMSERITTLERALEEEKSKSLKLDVIRDIINNTHSSDSSASTLVKNLHIKRYPLSLVILKSRPNKDGSFNVKIQISGTGRVAWIPTPYTIDNINEWDNGKIVNRPDSTIINTELQLLLKFYQSKADEIDVNNVTPTDVKRIIIERIKGEAEV